MRLEDANSTLKEASKILKDLEKEAIADYILAKSVDPDIAPFNEWVVERALQYIAQKGIVQSAASRVRTARKDCYGVDANQVNEDLNKIKSAVSMIDVHNG